MITTVFGDSIADGQWDARGGWAEYLRRENTERHLRNPSDGSRIFNLSIGGNTTRNIIDRLPGEVASRSWWIAPADLEIVVAVGVNDAAVDDDGAFISNLEQYAQDLEELYELASPLSSHLVFVGLLPVDPTNDHVSQSYNNARIWDFEQVLRKFVSDKQLSFVPVFELFTERLDQGATLFTDGIHPNTAGHRLLYEAIQPVLKDFS